MDLPLKNEEVLLEDQLVEMIVVKKLVKNQKLIIVWSKIEKEIKSSKLEDFKVLK